MNRHRWLAMGAGALLLAWTALTAGQQQAGSKAKADQPLEAGEYTISGPYADGNLTIFLLHGKGTAHGKEYLTLQEALEQKKMVVHETKNVNELSVENVSDDAEVFIQAGDIVKGGQQDRVLSYDLIVAAKSGKVPIQAFCVESGRWQRRGSENAARFSSSANQVAGKDLKKAVNYARDQSQVWDKVRETQMKLSKNLGKSVAAKQSPTSLQLCFEDKELLKNIDDKVKALAKIPEGKKEVIGYAVAINGQLEGADVYGSTALFQKLWPKILRSCAIDALAELQKDKKFEPAKAEAVKAFLADAAKGKKKDKDIDKRVRIVTQETEKNLLIETRDRDQKGVAIHRSYLAK